MRQNATAKRNSATQHHELGNGRALSSVSFKEKDMSNKIKPWQQRKPKHHGKNEQRGKRVVPLRADGDRRIVPMTVDNSRVSPLTVDDDDSWTEPDYWNEEP